MSADHPARTLLPGDHRYSTETLVSQNLLDMVLLDSHASAGHTVFGPDATLPSVAEEKLQFLVQASTELIASDDLDELLRRVLGVSKQLIDADAYALWSFDPDTKRWDIASAEGLSREYLDSAAIVLAGTQPGIHGTIAASDALKEPLLEGRRDAYRDEGIQSLLVVPLRVARTDHGTLAFYYRTPHESADEDIAIAESLASLASAAINSFRLREQQRSANAALSAANRRLSLLSEASAILGDGRISTDDEFDEPDSAEDAEGQSLTRLSGLLMPEVADLCVLDLFEREAHTRRINVAVSPGTRGDLVDAVHIRRWRTSVGSSETFADAIANGRSVLVESIDEEWLAACTPSKKQRDLARRLPTISLMIAPLRIAGRIIGVFTLASTTRHYSEEDLQLVDGLARRTAATIESQRLLQDTRRVAAELRTANAAKDEFLGLVSHELRTPLTTIRGNAEVLSRHRRSLEDEHVDTALVDIVNESVRLHRIVENLLLLARFEQGKLVDHEPVVVLDVVNEIVARHRRGAP